MKKENIKTLTPITLKPEFKTKYQIQNFRENIFIVTLDNDYYYYLTSVTDNSLEEDKLQTTISKKDAIDHNNNIQSFEFDYTLDFSKVFRIKKEELHQFIKEVSLLRVNWDKQLDIVVTIDNFINQKTKIQIILINEERNQFLSVI